ncbi:MBL fold metallo-hydrolase [Rhodovibrio salinarum]|nr:MBL fold metallo-hydrolase [Rhodovibrio salinarum]
MRLTVLGCGDAFGSGGRLNTCFQLDTHRADDGRDTRLLVDCGASAMISMHRFGTDPDSIDAVAVTHLHGDHFGGLPFLLLYLQFEAKRTRPLEIVGPPGIRQRVKDACTALFGSINCDWHFDLTFREWAEGVSMTLGGVAVTPRQVYHGEGITAFGLRITDGEKTFAYSGDTKWVDALPDLAEQADLFIVECYAFDRSLPTHTDYQTLKRHLDELSARRIALTHMSTCMLDRQDELRLEALDDGRVIEL